VFTVRRYDEDLAFATPRDSLADLADHLHFCTSLEFARELLIAKHAVAPTEAKSRSQRLTVHVRTALHYLDQALSSRPEVASVACYYAGLNLAKCYILASPLAARMELKMSHGMSYKTYAKDSQKLPTEVIQVQQRGVLPSLYEALTGATMRDQSIKMGDVYPYLLMIGTEWEIATGEKPNLAEIAFDVQVDAMGRQVPVASLRTSDGMGCTLKTIPALAGLGYKKRKGSLSTFYGPSNHSTVPEVVLLRRSVHRHLLYDYLRPACVTPLSGRALQLPEEVPLLVAFYHLSSIQRYNPEFMTKLKDSKFWPLVLAMQWHGLQRMFLLAWSYLQQKNVTVNTGVNVL
jgi:YaaC-like Protein